MGILFLLLNVVLFILLNIFNLITKYLSSRTGFTANFTFKSFLITSHILCRKLFHYLKQMS